MLPKLQVHNSTHFLVL